MWTARRLDGRAVPLHILKEMTMARNLARRAALVLAGALGLLAACGGGGGDAATAEELDDIDRAEALGLRRPIVIGSYGPNVVSIWRDVAAATAAVPVSPTGATLEERVAGPDVVTVQLAIYDAVIAIARTHKPFATRPATPVAGASMEAAAIEAAYRVLKGLFPSRGDKYQAAYDSGMAAIAAGDAKTRGMAIGAEAAQAMLALRANDGRDTVLPPYVPGTLPGDFRGLNPVNRVAPYIRRFAITSVSQFRPDGPPALTSRRYAKDFNDVKALGGSVSALRTTEQAEVARFYTEPPGAYFHRNLRQFATSSSSLAENARLIALLMVVNEDAPAACFDAKYHYNFWRPQSAIPFADADANPLTEADPAWTPFVPTPNHPEYPAAHGCGDGAVAEALRQFHGTARISFAYDSTVTGTTHHYDSIHDVVEEVINARTWGGMHFRSSTETGTRLGKQVARWVVQHHFRPRHGSHD
jgi:hypothetical protein